MKLFNEFLMCDHFQWIVNRINFYLPCSGGRHSSPGVSRAVLNKTTPARRHTIPVIINGQYSKKNGICSEKKLIVLNNKNSFYVNIIIFILK